MDKIYVAIDDSEDSLRAMAFGKSFAEQLDASLSIVSVVPTQEGSAARYSALKPHLSVYQLDETALEVVVHDSAKAYLGELAGGEHTGLCMMAHGRRPVPEMLIGSVTAGVVRRAHRPVYLCGPRYDAIKHQRVELLAVCVDGSKLSERILPFAAALAKRLKARLQLLQVLDSAASRKPTALDHADVSESSYLQGLARRVGHEQSLEVDWEVLHGDPADSIVSYLAASRNTMLAMTTHGRSGLSQVVAGSVSHEILHEASCPVAVMRP
ncbi:universal stress protein [Vreelandella arcis]|uniref:Nucleotide-binding universal stress protein, UspA family n=1 Tax=Vreelandella arcis TaxID=416873 RepID=A0A1G9X8X9_9GAMM|nr:universal stress protein [Halomonas arcis]SDM93117.1 Nucleotide-binding universal stress protein, UspA family [Halomonas arcis]